METTLEKLYTIPEVSKILRLSKAQVYILIQHRRIPHIRVSERRVVVRESDLVRYIDRCVVKVNNSS
jgi:excisionase family DNA binding protein